ncbi:hypothetical protein GCM10027277_21880 [Pseudoduganella ginsengisoli]|uniref:DUF3142 domain-containing protein n=1 Tax=Pseudoduganella ginsengisoli TaxID=1462440 RepID=A0A6L6PU61_9BURK|nr:hypothetical protein [Pseudoduganella ginsengisoli]MTW00558.1 hypothetical protein [Pseudoduganella ginsengisoli]
MATFAAILYAGNMIRVVFLFLAALGASVALSGDDTLPDGHPALARLPARMVWAWERPEDLRWLPPDVGVAYVASSIMLQGEDALVRPRTAALYLPEHAAVVPVLHVDVSWRKPPKLTDKQQERIVRELLRVAQRGNRRVVQLDFEVRRSQRPFLGKVMADIRRRLPPNVALSMTALASWCLDDPWLPAAHADEVVPMAFRMGGDGQALRNRLDGSGFTRPYCRGAMGHATDEPLVRSYAPRNYYFSPKPWTAERWLAVQSRSPS